MEGSQGNKEGRPCTPMCFQATAGTAHPRLVILLLHEAESSSSCAVQLALQVRSAQDQAHGPALSPALLQFPTQSAQLCLLLHLLLLHVTQLADQLSLLLLHVEAVIVHLSVIVAQKPEVVLQPLVSFVNSPPLSIYVLSSCQPALSFLQATSHDYVRPNCTASQLDFMQTTHVKSNIDTGHGCRRLLVRSCARL